MFNTNLEDLVAQEIKIRNAISETNVETVNMQKKYDGVSPYFDLQELAKNPHYYDGAKILFLPNSTQGFKYFGGFTIPVPVEIPDTIWSKDQTKIKKINMVKSNVYKSARVNAKSVRYFGKSRYGDSGVVYIETGYKTPASMIEGKVFTIKSCVSNVEIRSGERWLVLNIILLDEEGVEVMWDMDTWLVSNNYLFMPIIMYSYIEKYLQYVGKKYVNYGLFNVKDHSSIETVLDDVYECTELSYLDERLVYETGIATIKYYSPVLFYRHNGEDVHYNIIPAKNYGWLHCNNSMKEFNSLMEPDDFKQRALRECEEMKRKVEQRNLELAKKEADRKKAEANRLAELTKKYGAKNAKLIMGSVVQIGWNKQMCIESWGEPSEINKTITSGNVHEQWVYSISSYLYFDNGILTGIQN